MFADKVYYWLAWLRIKMLHLRENENKQTENNPHKFSIKAKLFFKNFAKCILSTAQNFVLSILTSVL